MKIRFSQRVELNNGDGNEPTVFEKGDELEIVTAGGLKFISSGRAVEVHEGVEPKPPPEKKAKKAPKGATVIEKTGPQVVSSTKSIFSKK